ncbi:fibrinogen gamma-B chain-like [Gigantopelta aegis]|uniref:fibrinogen gamma-B chain-like n=1 Tax=Gigantopelta aegis TaxID=1735272 RepID=UPI001B88A94B|nr:fibrinogen gamma-B chain-like [Gigantopelta aegis]
MEHFNTLFLIAVLLVKNLALGKFKTHPGDSSMQLFKFRKQPRESVLMKLEDNTKVLSLLACSLTSLEGDWDGFAYCRSFSSSNCFLFTASGVPYANAFANLVSCSFYVYDVLLSTPAANSPTTGFYPAVTSTSSTFSSSSTECINLTGGGCGCPIGATDSDCTTYIQDCDDYKKLGGTGTSYIKIKPQSWTGNPFVVRCEKGDTVIQMRGGGAACDQVQFNASWAEYKEGFGNMENGCFWLGNDKIASLTKYRIYKLSIYSDIDDSKQNLVEYEWFVMKDEAHMYRLRFTYVKQHKGTSDGLNKPGGMHQDSTTQDFHTHDNDISACAATHGAGWWYDNGCTYGNLNEIGGPVWPVNGKLTTLTSSYMLLTKTF